MNYVTKYTRNIQELQLKSCYRAELAMLCYYLVHINIIFLCSKESVEIEWKRLISLVLTTTVTLIESEHNRWLFVSWNDSRSLQHSGCCTNNVQFTSGFGSTVREASSFLFVHIIELCPATSDLRLARRQVAPWDLVAVTRTHLLYQSVVDAVERHVDADDPEGFGAGPGDVALGLLLSARLGRVVVTRRHLLVALRLPVARPAVERLRVLRVDHALTLQIELHLPRGRDEAHGHVAHTRGVVAEVDAERAVPVVHHLAHYQKIQFDGFDVWVKIPPAERCGEFRRRLDLQDGTKLYLEGRVGLWPWVSLRSVQKSPLCWTT